MAALEEKILQSLLHHMQYFSTEHKYVIQRGVAQLSTTTHSWIMKVFVKSIALFFWTKQIQKYKKKQFFVTKQGFLASKKPKKYSFE